jgi:hypothetical protein
MEVRRAPLLATKSKFGVLIIVEPLQLKSPNPISSQIITTIFGRVFDCVVMLLPWLNAVVKVWLKNAPSSRCAAIPTRPL